MASSSLPLDEYDDVTACLDELTLAPPVLRHQPASCLPGVSSSPGSAPYSAGVEDCDAGLPRWRSMPSFGRMPSDSVSVASEEPYGDEDARPVYRLSAMSNATDADLWGGEEHVYNDDGGVLRSLAHATCEYTPDLGEYPQPWQARGIDTSCLIPPTEEDDVPAGCYRSFDLMQPAALRRAATAPASSFVAGAVSVNDGDGETAPPVLLDLLGASCDAFDMVLAFLPAQPGLFNVMRVCKGWRDAARAHYLLQRVHRVPARPDELLHAYRRSRPGDTLRLEAGVHQLASELTIDRPVRLLSDAEAEAVLGPWQAQEQRQVAQPQQSAAAAPPRQQSRAEGERVEEAMAKEATAAASGGGAGGSEGEQVAGGPATYAEAVSANGGGTGADAAVLVASLHVLLRTRCNASIAGITLCRMGDEVGYPNAVTYAEAGLLKMERCRVTCGGAATSVRQALQAFAGAPAPGSVWLNESAAGPGDILAADGIRAAGAPLHDVGTQCPQSGVWIGAAACVELRGCTIANCMGPGVKIYRGRLEAYQNTIAYSSRGANVVANGGHVVLKHNEIQGANGDGVSSWNNSVMEIVHNSIHANSGAGIAVNTGGGSVTISHNTVFDNACQPVLFATSSKQATLKDNEFNGSAQPQGVPQGGCAGGGGSSAGGSSTGASSSENADDGPLPPPPPGLSRMSSRGGGLGRTFSGP